MTPKEKANELVYNFRMNVLDRDGTSVMNLFETKQCVLLTIDEILKSIPSSGYWHTYSIEIPNAIIYWQEVKQEVEKYTLF
jgi:hypothetical protein